FTKWLKLYIMYMKAITYIGNYLVRGINKMAQVAKGLEGIIASETKISSIIDNQLTYDGYDIDDLTENALFEEVMFLLWNLRKQTSKIIPLYDFKHENLLTF